MMAPNWVSATDSHPDRTGTADCGQPMPTRPTLADEFEDKAEADELD